MKRLIWITVFALLMSVNSAWALSAKVKEAIAQKEAYFKDPKNDVLFVISAVNLNTGAEIFERDIDITLTMTTGGSSDTSKTRTPYVMRFPMDEGMSVMLEEYRKTSGAEREKFLMQATLSAPTIVIMAQSQENFAGLFGHVYFAGKEVLDDRSAVEYGAINLSYTLPLRELLEAQK